MFEKLFNYTDWADKLFINKILEENIDHAVINRLMCHLLNAHHVWNSRIAGSVPEYGIWEEYSQKKWIQLHSENMKLTQELIKKHNPEDIIKYQNSKGVNFENSLSDILFHIINHASHHRPQISLLMRQSGYEPPKSDYIYYIREIITQ